VAHLHRAARPARRRARLVRASFAIGLAASVAASPAAGQKAAAREAELAAEDAHAAHAAAAALTVRSALQRGTAILLELQESFDALPDEDEKAAADAAPDEWPYEGVYRVGGRIPIGYRVGGTSIACWALLEAPGWAEDAPRRAAVERALAFVLAALERPLMSAGFQGTYDVRGWGHAYALTFLSRLRALGRVPEGRAAEVDARVTWLVHALEKTAIGESGGWNYSRRDGDRSTPSTFMTAATLQALFAAHAQGETVDAGVVRRALQALEDARLETGAFQYTTSARKSGRGFEAVEGAIGRMPICETTLLVAGRGSVERVRASLDAFFEHWQYLEQRRKKTGTHEPPFMIAPYYFFFAHAYAAQAIERLEEGEREGYRERLRGLLWKVREDSGGWNDRVFPRSENFGTAMSMLALLAPALPAPAGWTGDQEH
jgi:hypothetical protein